MTAYYNEHDPKAAAWLRELIRQGHIAPGVVDERSIEDVVPNELMGFTQCHFFAGIGGWSYALRLAGWPDDRPVWTGSCPCQPFSAAGKGYGVDDERHLWPAFFHLIDQVRPTTVFGEQVASKAGRAWIDLVSADLENVGYAAGSVDLCAASVGAPEIRQRLWWVGHTIGAGLEGQSGHGHGEAGRKEQSGSTATASVVVGVADSASERSNRSKSPTKPAGRDGAQDRSSTFRLADLHGDGRDQGRRGIAQAGDDGTGGNGAAGWPSPTNGYWRDPDWLLCRDGKWRPVESGTFPLADGISDCMADVLSCWKITWERISGYAKRTEADPSEILRVLRGAIHQEKGGEKPSVRVCVELSSAEILLDLLLGAEATRDGTSDRCRSKKESAEIINRAMRSMRGDCGVVRASRRWKPEEQREIESPASLYELSLILARDVEAYKDAVLSAHAALNRIGMLRGYGNAIVPQVAAEVIEIVMEWIKKGENDERD